MFCEARDILRFPTSAPDSVSAKLDANCSVLDTLVTKIDSLPGSLSSTVSSSLQDKYEALDRMVSDISSRLKAFSDASLPQTSFVAPRTSSAKIAKAGSPSAPTHATVIPRPSEAASPRPADRSQNVILFGVPESPFLETMDVVTKVFQYLVKQPVRISKIFRVGKRKHSSSVSVSTAESPEDIQKDSVRPRPVIVRFESARDTVDSG